MWHAYNLIAVGDSVRSTTIRKVQTESATGSSSSNRVRTVLSIAVEGIDFDTQACVLRLKGRNIEENQYVKVSASLLANWDTADFFRWVHITHSIWNLTESLHSENLSGIRLRWNVSIWHVTRHKMLMLLQLSCRTDLPLSA